MITLRAWPWAVLLISSALVGCTGSACANKVVYASPSPAGEVIVFVFHRNCGATGGVSTHVSIVAFHDALRNDTGNVMIVGGEQPIKASWRSPKRLVVSGFKDPTYQRAQQIDSVTVEFR